MEIIESINEMRQLGSNWRRMDKKVALVPTMGALHAGHLRLIQKARELAQIVVVSSFVNPLQFENVTDLQTYPRDPKTDQDTCEQNGVDYLFRPSGDEMYPLGYLTTVNVSYISERLEGKSRPGHFRGVCTVVSKLFNIVQPQFAIFGQKDAQQLAIIKKMVRDLCIDTAIVGVPTVRDRDGLALSSRNVRLTPEQRTQALCLNRALKRVHFLVKKQGIVHCGELLQAVRSALNTAGVKIDYATIVSNTTFDPIDNIEAGNSLVALAVWVGDVRLIDNTRL